MIGRCFVKLLETPNKKLCYKDYVVILKRLHEKFCAVLLLEVQFVGICRTRIMFSHIFLIPFRELSSYRSSRQKTSCKVVLKSFVKFAGKHLSLLIITNSGLNPEKGSGSQLLFCEFLEICNLCKGF